MKIKQHVMIAHPDDFLRGSYKSCFTLMDGTLADRFTATVDYKYIDCGEIDLDINVSGETVTAHVLEALDAEIEKARRYEEASPLERQIIEIKERYRIEYQKTVNALDRRDGSPAGQKRIRAEIERLRQEYKRLREQEIARIKE